MQLRLSQRVENLLRDTLQIFILTVIFGSPFNGIRYRCEIEAMERIILTTTTTTTSATPTPTPTPTPMPATTMTRSTSVTPVATATTTTTATATGMLTETETGYRGISTVISSTIAGARARTSDMSSRMGNAIARDYLIFTPTVVAPAATNTKHVNGKSTLQSLPDANEIDSIESLENEDYVMLEQMAAAVEAAAAAAAAESSISEHFNRTHNLSSLSLLSLNDTIATTKTTTTTITASNSSSFTNSQRNARTRNSGGDVAGTGHGHITAKNISSGASTGTFQHLGSQRILAAEPSATATSATHANINNNNNNNATNHNSNNNNNSTNRGNVFRISAKKVDSSRYVLPKPQKTDAPMLNYIFDTMLSANKHHHHDQRYGPHFEDIDMHRAGQLMNMTVQAGSSIHLNCRISLLHDKTVSWVRRNAQGENALDLLTVGSVTYTGDNRYKLDYQYPNNWRLKITNVKKDDEAVYECQISTHPPRVIQIHLLVNAPKVMIVDEFGDPLQEKYYEIDSTLQLSCVVRNVAMATSVVYWKHGTDVLNYDVTRGGVSVKTELMDDGANSTLSIAKINKADSGNYTCSISDFQNFTIVVHILNGESFAELHHGGAMATTRCHLVSPLNVNVNVCINCIILFLLLYCLPRYRAHINR